MKILVIGGTGMIGGHAALYLKQQGHDVTISGRKPAQATTELANLPFLQGDYVAGTFTTDDLKPFDAIVFAAGADIRHVPEGGDYDAHVLRANGEAVPAFAKLAKDAGVKHFIHVGSFYPHIAPELLEQRRAVDVVAGRHAVQRLGQRKAGLRAKVVEDGDESNGGHGPVSRSRP